MKTAHGPGNGPKAHKESDKDDVDRKNHKTDDSKKWQTAIKKKVLQKKIFFFDPAKLGYFSLI